MLSERNERDLVEAMNKIALWLKYLGGGDNASQEGAIELHSMKTREGVEAIASAIITAGESVKEGFAWFEEMRESNNHVANAITDAAEEIKAGLDNLANAITQMKQK